MLAHGLPHVFDMALPARSVLIVDDDDDWRIMAADVLAEAGFLVTTATDGRAGLASWRRARTQVVVTDVQMPIMDGCGLLAALHSIDRDLPVIVLTAEAISDASSVFPGAFRVIQKPVATDAVISAVTEALSRRRLSRGRRFVGAARALMSVSRVGGHVATSRAANFLRPRGEADRPVVPDDKRRGRAGIALVAGFGAATALALLIAAIRGLIV